MCVVLVDIVVCVHWLGGGRGGEKDAASTGFSEQGFHFSTFWGRKVEFFLEFELNILS